MTMMPPMPATPLRDGAVAVTRAALTNDDRDEMFRLLATHFDGVDRVQFERDLAAKDWTLRIFRADHLVGFTTMQVWRAMHDGRAINVVYSGDTIMAPAAWGSPVLARAWIALVRQLQASAPDTPWYWLLLSSGFRTYRFLPVFWRRFWPSHAHPTPESTSSLMRELAAERFGADFDAATGIVRFARPQRLRDHLAAVPDAKSLDAHVRFFLERNPGHASGDELLCLTELSDDNLTAAGERMVRRVP